LAETLLRIDALNVSHGDLPVLWDVNVGVDKGDIVSVVGANGAGKSTLINTISGLHTAISGSIAFAGERIDRLPAHRRVQLGIVQVPEGRRLFGFMSVLENLELGCYTPRARLSRNRSLEQVFAILPRLQDRLTQLAVTLSGGEQQMLAIGRGLMACPRLLLLDEPTLGLSPMILNSVFEIVRQINRQGVTVLLVEQNVQHALSLANRAYAIENGRIVLEGPGPLLLGDERLKKAYLGA